ncbi:MAG: VOC family protein [Luteimonas sp.]
MTEMITCVSFKHGQARQAAEFYAATFPDSHVGNSMHAAADYPGGERGDELTIEFTVLGRKFLGLHGGPASEPNESVSFMVLTEDQAQTDRYWNAIVDGGGSESACGWCKDRWGFSWQITPRALMEAMTDPDREAAGRAMQAMMTMGKIDIAAIEAARKGEQA